MTNEKIIGEHDGGFVAVMGWFEKDGKVDVDFGAIRYDGKKPTQEELTEKIRDLTGCKTADAHGVACYIVFEELNKTCPGSHHVGD